MADFKIAEKITGRNEGGYANNPADNGGETYAGIARNFWPKWNGWKTIDQIKQTKGKSASIINKEAKLHPLLMDYISAFYKQNFWDANRLDLFKDQQLANSVYDFGVNAGTKKAARMLQEVLGITADGVIGNQTIAAVNGANAKFVHDCYNDLRESFYRQLAEKPSQKQFLKSWLSRLKPYQA